MVISEVMSWYIAMGFGYVWDGVILCYYAESQLTTTGNGDLGPEVRVIFAISDEIFGLCNNLWLSLWSNRFIKDNEIWIWSTSWPSTLSPKVAHWLDQWLQWYGGGRNWGVQFVAMVMSRGARSDFATIFDMLSWECQLQDGCEIPPLAGQSHPTLFPKVSIWLLLSLMTGTILVISFRLSLK